MAAQRNPGRALRYAGGSARGLLIHHHPGRYHALARAVFFHRLGELRDRTFENQIYRASGLNLLVAAIILWNTRYLQNAVAALKQAGRSAGDDLARHIAPLGWEHISLTGDYIWPAAPVAGPRALREKRSMLAA